MKRLAVGSTAAAPLARNIVLGTGQLEGAHFTRLCVSAVSAWASRSGALRRRAVSRGRWANTKSLISGTVKGTAFAGCYNITRVGEGMLA
jgi:hypothetical protein